MGHFWRLIQNLHRLLVVAREFSVLSPQLIVIRVFLQAHALLVVDQVGGFLACNALPVGADCIGQVFDAADEFTERGAYVKTSAYCQAEVDTIDDSKHKKAALFDRFRLARSTNTQMHKLVETF